MAPILTADDLIPCIAAECAYADERGAVGIRLEPAAAIVRRYGEQFRRAPWPQGEASGAETEAAGVSGRGLSSPLSTGIVNRVFGSSIGP
jgi:hypothetical protein